MSRNEEGAALIIRAASALVPFQQGQLDALCGIYCILNAVQIASYPVRRLGLPKARSIFASAVAMMRKHHPHLNPASHGMANEKMIWLAEHIARSASTKRMQFEAEVCDTDDLAGWITASLNMGAPVVACLMDWAHFSVIVEMKRNGLVLFDSQGMSWLPMNECDVLADAIDGTGTIRVRRYAPTQITPSRQTQPVKRQLP